MSSESWILLGNLVYLPGNCLE